MLLTQSTHIIDNGNMNLQEQLNRIQEMMGVNDQNFINEVSDNTSNIKNKFVEEVEKTQFFNNLLNRFEIKEINGRDKLVDKVWNESYFTYNNQVDKTIDNVIYRTRFDATSDGTKELIKLLDLIG